MKPTLIALMMTAAGLVAAPAFADGEKPAAGTYVFDPDHSAAAFEYVHMGFSDSFGLVRGITGQVTLDPEDPSKSSVEASFPISSLLSVAATLDGHMRGKDMFDNEDGSEVVTFKSKQVTLKDDDEADVLGDLTLNGVTKEVTLEVDLKKAGMHPMLNKPTVGFVAETEIKRSDFGLGLYAPAVSDEVEIKISVEASQQ